MPGTSPDGNAWRQNETIDVRVVPNESVSDNDTVEQDPESARAEYAATNDSYMHYDAFRWQAGSFLIAGVFIFWGLLIQFQLGNWVIVTASLLVALLMSIWLLFAHHYRQIYMFKLHRLWELESRLGLMQHVRFRDRLYAIRGPQGHVLDMATYAVTSSGAIFLGIARNGFNALLLLPIPLILLVVWYVWRNERLLGQRLKTLDGGAAA